MKNNTRGEILAPCGNFEMAKAAVHNGAEAIYVGSPGLNARGRTIDFTQEELKEIIDFCHLHEVKVFIAMNVLIFERELQVMENYLRQILSLGPDALIVQDIGLVKLIKTIAPHQVVHASTQMTVSSAEAIHETEDLDMKRYVLSREMSLEEIQKVRTHTEKELEVFVHGALCVSYSGQCLTSESFGGRSANRGQCAQSCRLDYELYVDGKPQDLGSKKYLFSPQDLCGVDEVETLRDMGVDSYKIEGRLKSPEYVASTVSNFRKALDQGETGDQVEMASTYSRGLYPGWLHGVKHQELVGGVYSSNQGVLVGEVEASYQMGPKGPMIPAKLYSKFGSESDSPYGAGSAGLRSSIDPGDGVLFFNPYTGHKFGAKVYFVKDNFLGFSRDTAESEMRYIAKGWQVFRNSSPKIEAKLQKSWKDKQSWKRIPIDLKIRIKTHEKIQLELIYDHEHRVLVESEELVAPAQNRPLDESALLKGLGGFGGSSYELKQTEVHLEGDNFVSNKVLRQLKQQAIHELDLNRSQIQDPCIDAQVSFPTYTQSPEASEAGPKLNLLVRREDQLNQLAELPLNCIIMDFEFGKDYKPGLAKIKEMGYLGGIATLRVFKPDEDHHLKVIKWLKPEVILVRNLGALHWLKENMDLSNTTLIGDYSLNITNSMTSEWMQSHGLQQLHPAHDCNKEQLFDLIQQYGPQPWEISLHHYMPTFHMEHCVFAAFLSEGNSVKDCGKVCEHHEVEVRDHKGAKHFLKSDQECRNTLFNGNPQSASRLVQELIEFGVQNFRIEALLEESELIAEKVRAYSQLIHGEMNAQELFMQLGVIEKYGVTEGQLFNNTPFQDRKKDRV